MKTIKILIILFCSLPMIAQQNRYSNTIAGYSYESLLGPWKFESMTTIKKAKREEITIVYKDKKNVETLTFEESGLIIFNVLNDGIEKNGKGTWYAQDNYLTIIVESDTTYGAFSIENQILTLILNTEETVDSYGYSTILKYNSK